ncbi:MAG: substrate-binding domain-containing protein [Treponema sp.]
MKKIVMVSMILTLISGLVFAKGWGNKSSKTKKNSSSLVFGYAVQDLGNQYWVKAADGVKAQCKAKGITCMVMNANTDPATELSNVENMIEKKVNAILLSPWDSDSGATAVKAANKAGIPVFVLDIGVTSGDYVSLIISDNKKGGEMAGEYMASLLPSGAEVAHITCQLGYVQPALRGTGFTEAATAAGLKIVAKQPADSQRAMGMDVMQNLLQAHPDIAGVFCENDEMALGAVEAVAAAGKEGKISIIGFDGNDDAAKAVQNGRLAADVAQQPYQMGVMGVDAACDYLQGKPVEKTTFVPVKLIKK